MKEIFVIDGKKPCSTCKGILPVDSFQKSKSTKCGLRTSCKSCRSKYASQYLEKNREKNRLNVMAWAEKNKERLRASRKRWASENRGRLRAAIKNWEQNNKDAKRSFVRNYRARKRSAIGRHGKADIQFLLESQKGLCVVCKSYLGSKFHVDHIIALSNGGGNGRKDIQLLCAQCNFKKNKKDPIKFMQEHGYLL